MTVWQHLLDMDHLRRRAEGLIDASRKAKPVSASDASMGRNGDRYASRATKDLDMGTDLADMTSSGGRRN